MSRLPPPYPCRRSTHSSVSRAVLQGGEAHHLIQFRPCQSARHGNTCRRAAPSSSLYPVSLKVEPGSLVRSPAFLSHALSTAEQAGQPQAAITFEGGGRAQVQINEGAARTGGAGEVVYRTGDLTWLKEGDDPALLRGQVTEAMGDWSGWRAVEGLAQLSTEGS
jgi:hypothetical protein